MVIEVKVSKYFANGTLSQQLDKDAKFLFGELEDQYNDIIPDSLKNSTEFALRARNIEKNLSMISEQVQHFDVINKHFHEVDISLLHEELLNNLSQHNKKKLTKQITKYLIPYYKSIGKFKINVLKIISKSLDDFPYRNHAFLSDPDSIVSLDTLLEDTIQKILTQRNELNSSFMNLQYYCHSLIRDLAFEESEIQTSSFFDVIKEKIISFSRISHEIKDLLQILKLQQNAYDVEQYTYFQEEIKKLIHELQISVQHNLLNKSFNEYQLNIQDLLETQQPNLQLIDHCFIIANDIKYLCIQFSKIKNILNKNSSLLSKELANVISFLQEEIKNFVIRIKNILIEKLPDKSKLDKLQVEKFDIIFLQLESIRHLN
ncbi:hypothetical protein AB837_00516 [bacterium AB1]|nr:hypothetical protein AB837_00516 [bacterium AB1]